MRDKRIEKIIKNFHAIKRIYADGNRFASNQFGIGISQVSVLFLLLHKGSLSVSEIATVLGVSRSAATQLLSTLIEKEYVTKETGSRDKRSVIVTLSAKGKTHLKEQRKKAMSRFDDIFVVLSDEELAQIETITAKLANTERNQTNV